MLDRLEEDRLARQRALDLASFIVEAPAGAGKTELLTQRYLRLLAVVEQPEEVLALTFTNKAATEMRDRILSSLERAARGVMPPEAHKQLTFGLAGRVLEHDARLGWNLLAHPGRLRITTLDALCASLARQMPYLSRFGSQPGVAADAEAHYAAAARRTLEMLEAGDADADVVAGALAFMDNHAGRLEKLLVAMLGKRDQWLHLASRIENGALKAEVEAGFAALVERDLACVVERLAADRQHQLMPLARFAASNLPQTLAPLLDWQAPLTASVADQAAWQALANLLLTANGSFRKRLDKNIGFPADKEAKPHKEAMAERLAELAEVAGLEAALARLSGLPPARLSDAEWETVEGFSRLLRLAAGQLWLVFQEAGEVDFIEIAARASLALGDEEAPTDLAQALDYRIRHLLVDEFQDTSPSQVALIAKLMRGWQPDDGRTLFVVGDPMQSIYRFRKADVGLFLNIRAHGLGDLRLEHLRLFRNNRSYPAVVDWVNAVFPAIFPAEDAPATGAVRYAESAATRQARSDAGVQLHPVLAEDAARGAQAEARQVLALIRQARQAAPEGQVAVLVRARSHLEALVGEMRRSAPELHFQAVEIEGLADRQHVQDLLTLFRALQHRADRVHWLAMLRAPWCGLTLADLHALVADDRRRTVWQLLQDETRLARLSADGRQRLAHLRDILRLAFAQRDRQHPRRWLESVWLMLNGPSCLVEASELADVETFFRLLEQLAAAGELSADTLQARLGELFAPADPLGAGVQLMTIHKSKGLEFDTVILPGLHRDTGGNESNLLLWDEVVGPDGREHLLVAPMKASRVTSGEATAYDYLRRLENERAAHEDERLLYVAATRAIRVLHLLGVAVPDARKEDGVQAPVAGSLLHLMWPGLARQRFVEAAAGWCATGDEAAVAAADCGPPLRRLRSLELPALWQAPLPVQGGAGNPAVDAAGQASPLLEAAVGTLVHRGLELIARQGLAHWPISRLADLLPAWQRWLGGQGHAAEAAAQGAREALQALQTTLSSEVGRWLLSPHAEAGAEQAWTSREGEASVQHVIDRVFVAEDGCRWLIDYKTVRVAASELPARAESFRPQLARYARLFAGDPRPLRAAIFFPLQGCLIELPGPLY